MESLDRFAHRPSTLSISCPGHKQDFASSSGPSPRSYRSRGSRRTSPNQLKSVRNISIRLNPCWLVLCAPGSASVSSAISGLAISAFLSAVTLSLDTFCIRRGVGGASVTHACVQPYTAQSQY